MEQLGRFSQTATTRWIHVVFVLALLFSLWAVSVGWNNPNLPGYEFRQAQTGISALFIQKENNFSLAYPTPVLGPPWSIPMEFPLYQWTVAATTSLTGLPLTQSGRLIGVISFYLGLPAFLLMLRRLGATRPEGLLGVSLLLLCPLYLFYARAFLIETMALSFGLWYFVAFINAIERRHRGWLFVAILGGLGVALIKVTTFLVFLLPAFFWSLHALKLSLTTTRNRLASIARTLGWLVAIHGPSLVAALWWTNYADGVKALNLSGSDLQSFKLTDWNFGDGNNFSVDVWRANWQIISQQIVHPVVLAMGSVLAFVAAPAWRKPILACLAIYASTLTIFPGLYSIHAYYHVAAAFLLCGALAMATIGALRSDRLPNRSILAAWTTMCLVQVGTYFSFFYDMQQARGENGSGLTEAIKKLTDDEQAIVVAGDDWSSIIPYYSERRALMIKSSLERNPVYQEKAFIALKAEASVGALVLLDEQCENTQLLALAKTKFDLGDAPSLTWNDRGRRAVVYLNPQLHPTAAKVFNETGFHGVALLANQPNATHPLAGRVVEYRDLIPSNRQLFSMMSPRPARFYSTFGPSIVGEADKGNKKFFAHPDSKFWFTTSPGSYDLTLTIELPTNTYEGLPVSEASDGIEVTVTLVQPSGIKSIVGRRTINPRDIPADRGLQTITWVFTADTLAELEIAVTAGSANNSARDWANIATVTLQKK